MLGGIAWNFEFHIQTHITQSTKAMKSTIRNFQKFQKLFPNEDVCLEYVFKKTSSQKCDSCGEGKRYRVSGRKCYACSRCGKQLHPLSNTLFEKSSTPLTMWFYAIFIIAHSKRAISARDLEGHLGVTYKTAWRMLNGINKRTKTRGDETPVGTERFWSLLDEIVC